ncbi:MAG: IPExxxVDY family protein [Cyclobacteriaceae bacterium]
MKKNKLDLTYEFDFELAGIVCNKKEYKLAWYLNSELQINLEKKEDIKIEFSSQPAILISNFKYETEFLTIELLKNRLLSGGGNKPRYLISELMQFDYLLKLRDETGEMTISNVCTIIREIPLIEYVIALSFDGLKSKENLLY